TSLRKTSPSTSFREIVRSASDSASRVAISLLLLPGCVHGVVLMVSGADGWGWAHGSGIQRDLVGLQHSHRTKQAIQIALRFVCVTHHRAAMPHLARLAVPPTSSRWHVDADLHIGRVVIERSPMCAAR